MGLLDNYKSAESTSAPPKSRLDSYTTPQTASAEPTSSSEKSWGDYARELVSAPAAIQSGLIKAATFGNFDPARDLPGDAKLMYQQGVEENPGINRAAEIAGGVGMGSVVGAPIGAATKALGLATPAASALGAVGKAAGRTLINAGAGAAQGYVSKPGEGETRGENALTSGLLSGGLSTAGEIVGAVADPAARISRNLKAQKNPEEFGNYARDVIEKTRGGLLESEKKNASKLEELLRGKQVPVDGTSMEGNELNALKKMYDSQARRPKGAMWSTGEAAKAAEAGREANKARAAIQAAVPESGPLNSDMQREIKLREWLRGAKERSPAGALLSSSKDKQALLAEAGRRAGTDISKVAGDSRLAKTLTFNINDLTHPWIGAGKGLVRAGMAAAAPMELPASILRDPASLSAILNALETGKE